MTVPSRETVAFADAAPRAAAIIRLGNFLGKRELAIAAALAVAV